MEIEDAQLLWTAEPGWLNTASYGLPPAPAWEALQQALGEWRRGHCSWEAWGDATERARASFARLTGFPARNVATGANVSSLVGTIAASLPDGANVLVPDTEFTSNLFPWMVQQDRGVTVTTVPAARLAEAVDGRTSVVAFSHVQSASGQIADCTSIVAAARAHDSLVVVDATQACGWLPIDRLGADAVVCGAYKWLMSPRGTAFLAVGDRLLDGLRPVSAGWYAGEDPHDSYYGPPLRLARSARRLDVSPAWFSWVGTAPALAVLEDLGVPAVHDHDTALANRFCAGLGLPSSDSAIVSVEIPDAALRLERAGIRAAVRAGRLRASFHVYTTDADVDRALAALTG